MEQALPENFTVQYLDHLLKGDKAKCSAIVKHYLLLHPSVINLYENLLKVALYEVGVLWEANKISVATEHMATAITESILNELFDQIISKKRLNKKVVVTCVENEDHQIGIKLVADVFEMNGWDSYFLGTGIPNNELVRFIKEIKPDLIAISLTVYFNYSYLLKTIDLLKKEFPELLILIGGQAISRLTDKTLETIENVIILSDLYILDKYVNALNTNN